jgi:hypothetical protein
MALALLGALLPYPVMAETDIATLNKEKTRLELEAAIEKSKADIAVSKKTQQEAEKAQVLTNIPPTKTEALSGSVNASNFGSAGLVVAVDLLNELASSLCEVIDDGQTAIIYDATTISGITFAHAIDTQLSLYEKSLDKALNPSQGNDKQGNRSGVAEVAVATGAIKTLADFASLFKTNVTVNKTDFSDAKQILLTAMASRCPEKLTSFGVGYMGDLVTTQFDTLLIRVEKLLDDKAKLDDRILMLKKQVESEKKDSPKKKTLQKKLDDLLVVSKSVEAFMVVLKPTDLSATAPLPVAAKYLALSKRTEESCVFDVDIKLEGLTITKENIFTGQKLRLSAIAIVWYRLYGRDGKILKAGVSRKMAKPVEVDLRGEDAKSSFWSK